MICCFFIRNVFLVTFFVFGYLDAYRDCSIYLRSTPHPVTVTNEGLWGFPIKNGIILVVTGWGVDPKYISLNICFGPFKVTKWHGFQELGSRDPLASHGGVVLSWIGLGQV